jgi:hypothetical protein
MSKIGYPAATTWWKPDFAESAEHEIGMQIGGEYDRHGTRKPVQLRITNRKGETNKQEQSPSSSLPFDDGFVANYVSEAGLGRKFPLERAGGEIEVVRMAGETHRVGFSQ